MASGPLGRVNSVSQGFDFGSDDIHSSYNEFDSQEVNNGTHADKDFHKRGMARPSFVPAPAYNQPEDSLSQEVINVIERSMKRNSDNLMRFLEGISSRLSQLELYCYNVDKSIGEMRSELVRGHGEVDSKLNTLEKRIGEFHQSVLILRDKQELAEAHKKLAKLQLAQKEYVISSQSQQNEEMHPTPAIEPQIVSDSSDLHKQQLTLAPSHRIPPLQGSQSSRIVQPLRPVVTSAQARYQNIPIPQQQDYHLAPSQIAAHAQQRQVQGQFETPESQYQLSQLQDMSRVPPQAVQSEVNLIPPASQVHRFPQYQQQWPQQLSQQQLQSSQQLHVQPHQQPPDPTFVRPQSAPVYPSYQTSQPASPPPDTIPVSMASQMQFQGVTQPRKSRAEALPYGYGAQHIQQQPPTQQIKGNFGTRANDGYSNMSSHQDLTPSSGYMMYGNEERISNPPPLHTHFSPGGFPTVPQSPMTRNPSQSQLVRNQPHNDLVEKLANMGFRGDHANNMIQMMENSGQPINFNSVFDRLSAQSSGNTHRGWSG